MSRRILTRRLAGWIDPASAFELLFASAPDAFWLDAGPEAVRGQSYIGAGEPLPASGDLPQLVDTLRQERRALGDVGEAPAAFGLGWVGFLGYEFGAAAQGVPVANGALPGSAMLWVARAIAFDHEVRTVTLLSLDGEPDAEAWLDETARALEAAGPETRPERPAVAVEASSASWRHGPAEYEQLILACQESIRRGDAYQLCLTNEITVDVRPDPWATYLRLRRSSPSHHGGYLRTGHVALLGASPEQFLRIDARGLAETKPIKGTRPRASDPDEDARLAAELLASDKERAENLMIVDLMRNDLAKVAQLGSVQVRALLEIESYSAVHQLVSTVTARLAPGLDALDAVTALFPAGSMTGAPKSSAMRILHRLENGPRGIYAGVFGYVSLDGAIDLAMVIRSIVLGPQGASIGTGGGITALSLARDEVEETRIKAAPLLAALGVRSDRPG
ncbi:aminodeoxychorismate synthase component I [Agreia sp. COWG]|uniref:aminodeoxychorismate synthase component I n=1 Tax=Agreia sp. COWG TaxID=2773266 RepID=UPI001AF2792A|nr:aminodeoxychorismate synthase component I [Agreia sp. COWG]CAD5996586.1 Anthranilate synthase component 1 [Agreia sp. COWG]